MSLSVSEVVYRLALGDVLENKELTVTWNSKSALTVEKITYGDTPIAIIFESFGTDITLLDPNPKCTSIAGIEKCTSTDTILYSLAVPTKDMDDCVPECISEKRYDVPVQVFGKIGNDSNSATGSISVDLGKQASLPLYLVVMMATIPIIGVILQKTKNGKKKRQNAVQRYNSKKK